MVSTINPVYIHGVKKFFPNNRFKEYCTCCTMPTRAAIMFCLVVAAASEDMEADNLASVRDILYEDTASNEIETEGLLEKRYGI
jgi:hypothetical protein